MVPCPVEVSQWRSCGPTKDLSPCRRRVVAIEAWECCTYADLGISSAGSRVLRRPRCGAGEVELLESRCTAPVGLQHEGGVREKCPVWRYSDARVTTVTFSLTARPGMGGEKLDLTLALLPLWRRCSHRVRQWVVECIKCVCPLSACRRDPSGSTVPALWCSVEGPCWSRARSLVRVGRLSRAGRLRGSETGRGSEVSYESVTGRGLEPRKSRSLVLLI